MKKILLIGDSIKIGYEKYVKMAFEGSAEVYSPTDNCRFTGYILRHLLDWKNELNCGDDVDLVHWNSGLWDDLIMIDGKAHTSLALYRENVERICNIIKLIFPNAKMVFATTTPVQEELFKTYKRYNSDTEKYNEAACEIVKKHGGYINDLYSLLKDVPAEYHSDLTHFYTREATEIISNQVIKCIENLLDISSKPLDYDKVFKCDSKPAVGM